MLATDRSDICMNDRVSGTPVSSYFTKTPTERFPHNDNGSKVSGMELNQYVG